MKTSRIDYPFEIHPLSKDEGAGIPSHFRTFRAVIPTDPLQRKLSTMAAMHLSPGLQLRASAVIRYQSLFLA